MYARNWQEMSISHELEDTKSTTLVVVSWNLGSPSVNINSNFTSEVSYKEDALLLTIHSKEVDCSYLGKYTCRLALPGQNYQNTTSVKGTLIEIKLQCIIKSTWTPEISTEVFFYCQIWVIKARSLTSLHCIKHSPLPKNKRKLFRPRSRRIGRKHHLC